MEMSHELSVSPLSFPHPRSLLSFRTPSPTPLPRKRSRKKGYFKKFQTQPKSLKKDARIVCLIIILFVDLGILENLCFFCFCF